MPSALTYPGVYIEEISSGVHTITGVATSITAFVGRAIKGPTDADLTKEPPVADPESPVVINGFPDFERIFGGLSPDSTLGFAVRDFFLNGGAQAVIVRLVNAKGIVDKKTLFAQIAIDPLKLRAAYPGKWGVNLRVMADVDVSPAAAKALGFFVTPDDPTSEGDPSKLFNLFVTDVSSGQRESFLNLTLETKNTAGADTNQRIDLALSASKLVRWNDAAPAPGADVFKAARDKQKALRAALDSATPDPAAIKAARIAYADELAKLKDPVSQKEGVLQLAKQNGDLDKIQAAEDVLAKLIATTEAAIKDDKPLINECFVGNGKQASKTGLFALERTDLFNLLCIPPYTPTGDVDNDVIAQAARYCEERRAFYIVDPNSKWTDKAAALAGVQAFITNSKNAALFFPRIREENPFHDYRLEDFAPCGALAGIFARTDTSRGVWKAPAGLEASLVGVPELSVKLTDAENGELNPKGLNCLRSFPAAGRVVWGSRTLSGADALASEWKYIPVRRTALFIEESLYRGTQWVVFEPNDEPLWAQIRLNVGAFMRDLFRQGAFQGQTPKEAYFVKCDKETTTQSDINRGVVNIIVGFAPLKPAEFVVIKLQQMAGQIET